MNTNGNPTGRTRISRTTFTTGVIARVCEVAPRTVAKWCDSGQLKYYRIPGSKDRRITRDNLIQFLKKNGMPLGQLQDETHVITVGVDPDFVDRVGELLGERFSITASVSTFEAGLAAYRWMPAVLVVDFWVGRAVAREIAVALRAAFPDTKVVGLVGDDEADEADLKASGFTTILHRPLSASDLAATVRSLVN